MKKLRPFLLFLLVILLIAVYFNYPKLNILAGYSAKYASSSIFIADRTLAFTDKTDLDFSPINFASNEINTSEKSATSSAFGLLKRKAVYREGLGSVLVLNDDELDKNPLKPKRLQADNITPYPYGNAKQKDTIFSNIDYAKLNNAVASIFSDSTKTRAVVVIYKDQIITEKYDEGFDKNSKILGWSMTKSITGTLIGMRQFEGKLNVQDEAPVKEWQNDLRKEITIHNLLQMNSGLEWDENYDKISDATQMLFLDKDMTKMQVKKQFVGKPNQTWNYSSGTTNLLSGILRSNFNTHQEYLDYWYVNLIDKIGMNSMLIETDLSGNYVGSSYGWATPRDWAKLGLLYLKNGSWKGEQLFDKAWVDYATKPTPTSDGWYGAQIWLNAGNRYPDVPKNMYSFNGYQGQNVFILPDQEMVIVRMGLTKKADVNNFLSGILTSIK